MSALTATALSTPPSFRFDRETHTYTDARGEIPHITGILSDAGLIDDQWYTEESSDRGRAVHNLTAAYDLGALDAAACVSPFRGWLLAHVKAMRMVQHEWDYIEEPMVHPLWRFGGRCDRVGRIYRAVAVGEIKSGDPARSHPIQTALQAILVAPLYHLPPRHIQRYGFYYTGRGRLHVEQHVDPADFDKAEEYLRKFAGRHQR